MRACMNESSVNVGEGFVCVRVFGFLIESPLQESITDDPQNRKTQVCPRKGGVLVCVTNMNTFELLVVYQT